ncbi:MAG: trigger factor [Deltaproteobacteria bacterium]|nr:trigger factor [Deltaproteobacteria bacterium]
MQITIEDISPVEKRVDFEVPWPDVAARLDRAYDKLRREARLKGFRPGKVPRQVVVQLYKHRVEEDVARESAEFAIGQAVREKQIEPIAPPTVDKLELRHGEPLKFSARVEVRSQVTPKDYMGVRVARRPAKVSEEQIDKELEGYRRRFTQFKPVENRQTTAADDVVTAEVHGRIGEHKVKTRTVQVDLSDENAGGLPGLAERLRGVPLDAQALEVKYQVPADSPVKSLAGRDVSLRVTIKEVRSRKVPALDDELAKDTGEADTLADLRNKVRGRLLEAENQRIKREMGQALIEAIVKANPFAVAPSLVERYAADIVYRTKMQLAMMGLDLEAGGFDDEAMLKEVRGDAEAEAKGGILVQAIGEREGVEASEGDVQKRIAELAAARGESSKKLRAELENNGRIAGVKSQIVHEKTVAMLLAQAKIVDEDPDRMIITPEQAGKERLIVTPEEAAAEAAQRRKGK